jgi:predicted RNA binding protein YcfA (HicA-like mRNA interferase family)
MNWPATKANRVLAALLRIGWSVKRQSGSHRVLQRSGWPNIVFAFHEQEIKTKRLRGFITLAKLLALFMATYFVALIVFYIMIAARSG